MFWVAAELPPSVPAACVVRAAEHYDIPVVALVAIAQVEGGEVGRRYDRPSGSYYGPYQISSKWVPALKEFGYTRDALQNDACANAQAGAYILAQYRFREGGNLVRALGRYNVGSLNTSERYSAAERYVKKVVHHWHAIYARHAHEVAKPAARSPARQFVAR